MKILVLQSVKKDPEDLGYEYTFEYKEGKVFDDDNYIGESVTGNYSVEFDYNGIPFSESIVIKALSDYFDKQSDNKEIISYSDFEEMFSYHSEVKDTDKITKIKRICIEYVIKELNKIHFE